MSQSAGQRMMRQPPAGRRRRGQPTGSGASSDMSLSAVRAAVYRAHWPLVRIPAASTSNPQPVMIHQPAWLALTRLLRDGPASTEGNAEPTTATPRDWPTCLLVDAMAAATPAWVRGIPETAVFVMVGFTRPKPIPKMT